MSRSFGHLSRTRAPKSRSARVCPLILLSIAFWLSLGASVSGFAQTESEAKAPVFQPDAALLDTTIAKPELALRLAPLSRMETLQTARLWFVRAQVALQAEIEAELAIVKAGAAVSQPLLSAKAVAAADASAALERLSIVVDSFERKGGDPETVGEFRDYLSNLSAEKARMGGPTTWVSLAADWVISREGGGQSLRVLLALVVGLFVLLYLARIGRRWVQRGMAQLPQGSDLLNAFVGRMVFWIVVVIGFLAILSMMHVDITPLYAVLGGASFGLALALQGTLGNLAAGFMIMINRPFDIGDYVRLAGVAGSVEAVSIVSTRLRTPDNQCIVIPNSSVWGTIITNVTAAETRRVDLVFGIGYADDMQKAQTILMDVLGRHPRVLKDPAPLVRLHELAESSVNFVVRPWTRKEDYWDVYWDITRQVKDAFDSAGISFPFPQRDVTIKTLDALPTRPETTPGPSDST